jgi:hypothetical protein
MQKFPALSILLAGIGFPALTLVKSFATALGPRGTSHQLAVAPASTKIVNVGGKRS